MISVYRKGVQDEHAKLLEDVHVDSENPKVSTLKAKATRLLKKHTRARQGDWRLSREHVPEWYREARVFMASYQVRIHRRDQW